MEDKAPSVMLKDLDSQIRTILRPVDILKINRQLRDYISDLRQSLIDARIYTTDYELSEMREQQLNNAKLAKKYLESARKDILSASEYNIFNAVDVALLTAVIDQVKAKLK